MIALLPYERCASTSNRNFEGRQGDKGRTHLVSPSMAALAAIKGHFSNVIEFMQMKNKIIEGQVIPFDQSNIDTDAIIPKQYLKSIKKSGFGPFLFDSLRYTDPGDLSTVRKREI